jgi:hypothetical protein
MKNTETLIIGFGMAAIPILRELQKTNNEYLIISENTNIWRGMKENNKLSFDLVSTKFSTLFSWDLAGGRIRDGFSTASEFYEYQSKYYDKYKKEIIKDTVIKIENFENHSLAYTKKGKIYKANNIVLAGGFSRKVAGDIINFDTNIRNKTIVFDTIGDTTNMFIADLIANENTLYALSNGFRPLNKTYKPKPLWWDDRPAWGDEYTLDQFEYQNVAFYSKKIYEDTLGMSLGTPMPRGPGISELKNPETYNRILKNKNSPLLQRVKTLGALLVDTAMLLLSKVFCRNTFHVKYDNLLNYHKRERNTTMPTYNGIILKYWPIDVYSKMFAEDLEKNIKKGHKLNDLPFLIEEKLVRPLQKNEAEINEENKEIIINGRTIEYDKLIKGGLEEPRLNDIEITDMTSGEKYNYVYRENYLGVIPRGLKNIYLAGLTRPNTGGFGNIAEIQSLLIHKMIINKKFKAKVLKDLEVKIKGYNEKYYETELPCPIDHVVFYGFYIEEVAREIGINLKLGDCKNKADYFNFFFVPNNSSKYRVNGEYKIKGMRRFYKRFLRQYNLKGPYNLVTTYLAYRLIYYALTILAMSQGYITIPLGISLLFIQTVCSRFFMLFIENSPQLKWFSARLWLCAIPFIPLHWNLFPILLDFGLIPILRRFGWSTMFNDLSSKKKYRKFFYEDYLPTLKRSLDSSP